MRTMTKILAGGAGIAAFAAASPAPAQYYYGQPYGYGANATQCRRAEPPQPARRTERHSRRGSWSADLWRTRSPGDPGQSPPKHGPRSRSGKQRRQLRLRPVRRRRLWRSRLRLCPRPVVPLRGRLPRLHPRHRHQPPPLTARRIERERRFTPALFLCVAGRWTGFALVPKSARR